MICTIMQPTYLPWAGGFDLLDEVDVFAYFDDVQIVRRSWDVRNRIKSANGEVYLTIPIQKTRHRDRTFFNNAIIDDREQWRQDHLNAIAGSYRRALFFDEVFSFIEPLIKAELPVLADFNIHCITAIAHRLGIHTQFVRTSSLRNSSGTKDIRLVNICKELEAEAYLSPLGAHQYIEKDNPGGAFENSGVRLYYHNYSPVQYSQLHGEFMSHMCILDLLFNEGFSESLQTIRRGRKPMLTSRDLRQEASL